MTNRAKIAVSVGVVVLGLLAIVGVSRASASDSFWAGVQRMTAQFLAGQIAEPAGLLGSTAFPDCGNSDQFSDCPSTLGNLYLEGGIEVDSASYFDAAVTISAGGLSISAGDVRLPSLVQTGATTTLTASTTDMTVNLVTAANICDNGLVAFSIGNTTTPTFTLPATTTLYSDCLTTDGDEAVLTLLNTSAVTSTVIAAGSGGTLDVASSTTMIANNTAKLWIQRVTANAYRAMLTTFNN